MKKLKKILTAVLVCVLILSNINVVALTTSKWQTIQNTMKKLTSGIVESETEVTNFVDENGKSRKRYLVTYTIPEDFNEDSITIVPNGYINDCALPGDDDVFIIKIENKSQNKYNYVDNSFILSTEDFSIYTDEEIGKQVSDAYSFTDTQIREKISFYRTKNTALQKLYNVNKTSKITKQMLQDSEIDKVMDKQKYPNGSRDLNKYYLDFYNEKYNTQATRLEDLPDKAIAEMFNGNYTKDFKETNKEVIELAFNFLYNKLVAFTFNQVYINDDNSENYSVGSYMRKEKSYEEANALIKESLTDLTPSSTKEINMPHVYLNGKYMTNIYQNYYIGFYIELKLEKDKPIEEPKKDDPIEDNKEDEKNDDDLIEEKQDEKNDDDLIKEKEDDLKDDEINNEIDDEQDIMEKDNVDEVIEILESEYPLPPKTDYEG